MSSTITGNVISYAGARDLPLIISSSGTVSNNSMSLVGESHYSTGVCVVPDESPVTPARSFSVTGNSINASQVWAGVYVANPGFTDTEPICISKNSLTGAANQAVLFENGDSVNESCQE